MGNQDWNQLGNDIKDMVQDAINSRDFSKLNQGINQAINGAVDNLGNLLGGSGSKGGHWEIHDGEKAGQQNSNYWEVRDDGQARRAPGGREPYQYGWQNKGASRRNQLNRVRPGQRSYVQKVRQPAARREILPPGPYKNPSGMSAAGYVMAIVGGVTAAGTGVALIICLLVALMAPSLDADVHFGLNLANSILFFLTILFGGICWGGARKIGLAKRFRQYVKCIRGRGYCQLEELARSVGRTVSFIKKDVKKMLNKGLFLEGHLDSQETCLITTDQAYDQYKTAQHQLEERQRQQTAPPHEEVHQEQQDSKVPREVQEVLDEGNTFLVHIRKCNDLIPGKEISDKITRMELIVQNIFKRVKNHPEVVPDLKRMMEYYLPTTVKLLDAYAELDAQPVQGENITNSKREIEQTLDTLNQAFEKLLDSIFKDTAWDVSTDISVLQTLLAQEGLTGDDFKMK